MERERRRHVINLMRSVVFNVICASDKHRITIGHPMTCANDCCHAAAPVIVQDCGVPAVRLVHSDHLPDWTL